MLSERVLALGLVGVCIGILGVASSLLGLAMVGAGGTTNINPGPIIGLVLALVGTVVAVLGAVLIRDGRAA